MNASARNVQPCSTRERDSSLRSALPEAAAVASGFGFVLGVDAQRVTSGFVNVGLVVVALFAGACLARRASGLVPRRVVGLLAALSALWLLPQRADNGSALILAVLFGAAAGLIAGQIGQRNAIARLVIPAVAVLIAARVIGSQDIVVAITAALVLVTAGLVERPLEPRRASRRRTRATATVLLVATVGFAMYVGAETPSVHWFGGGITHGPSRGGDVALTFDDGPNLTATLQIMRILDAAGLKGTFFEVGHAIDKEPWITRELYADGQELGNHSYHHDQWRWLDPRYPELQRTQATFQRTIGICPAFYRPPHGDRTPFVAHVVNDHHMRMILWDDSASDWAVTNPRVIAQRILRGVHPGSIVLLHDGLNGNPLADRRALVRALPLILDGLRAMHLHPVRLDQLIGGPAYVPCQ